MHLAGFTTEIYYDAQPYAKKGLQSSLMHGPTIFQLIMCGRCVVQNYTTTRSFTI